MCNCGKSEFITDLEEHSDRVEALRQAVTIVQRGSGHWKDVVLAAADFYNFLNGELVTSNIEKLAAIADILADD